MTDVQARIGSLGWLSEQLEQKDSSELDTERSELNRLIQTDHRDLLQIKQRMDAVAKKKAELHYARLINLVAAEQLLTDEQKTRACAAARRARADFVKTSTGFGPGGATADDVALMSQAVTGARMGVKASGGIRSLEEAQQMIRAGATRLGVSAGVRIVKEAKGTTVSESSSEKY